MSWFGELVQMLVNVVCKTGLETTEGSMVTFVDRDCVRRQQQTRLVCVKLVAE